MEVLNILLLFYCGKAKCILSGMLLQSWRMGLLSIYQSLLFFFQTLMSAVCRHTPAGMTVCVWTSREATTVCVRLVRAAVATAQRKKESDATERIGNPALTAVLNVPARYRRITQTHTYYSWTLAPIKEKGCNFSVYISNSRPSRCTTTKTDWHTDEFAILRMFQTNFYAENITFWRVRWINNEDMNDYIKGNRAKRELGW